MENWVFFAANLAFTAFNAWIGWKVWRRTAASDLPVIVATVTRPQDAHPQVVEIELLVTNPASYPWKAEKAELLHPRTPDLYYPLALMVQDHATGHPVLPKSLELPESEGRNSISLVVTAQPNGSTCREVIWVRRPRPGTTIRLRVTMQSLEPQPRRHSVTVKRSTPALNTVMPA